MPQLRYQRQDLLEHLSRHRDLGHLERDIAAVVDDLRADQFLIFEIAPARSATEQQYALRFTRLGGSIAPMNEPARAGGSACRGRRIFVEVKRGNA